MGRGKVQKDLHAQGHGPFSAWHNQATINSFLQIGDF